MGRRFVTAVACFALTGAAFMPAAGATTPKSALIYGDSLTWESEYPIAQQFAAHTGWQYHFHAVPGTAPCDWLSTISGDLASYHPSIVTIETAGNNGTPCMADRNGKPLAWNSPAYLANYRASLDSLFSTITKTGARLVFVNAPPMGGPNGPAWNPAIASIINIGADLAHNYPNVSISNAPRTAVTASNQFTYYRTCLKAETASAGCTNGKIAVRTVSGNQLGVHFCPTGIGYPTFACKEYSSGEYRWARADVAVIVRPPAPVI